MAKLKITILPDGTIKMLTQGVTGEGCMKYIKKIEQIAKVKVSSIEKTDDFYLQEGSNLDEMQNLKDN